MKKISLACNIQDCSLLALVAVGGPVEEESYFEVGSEATNARGEVAVHTSSATWQEERPTELKGGEEKGVSDITFIQG